MNTDTPTDFLVKLADNHYFVLGAYFFAFFPWGVTSNIDFISEKWRTIRRTRNLAYIHLVSSIVPVVYVALYAEAQRRKVDSKEYGAALAALGFNLMNLMRTVNGMVQLDAFLAWCKHAMECVRALRGDQGEDNASENDGQEDDDVEGKLKANNTVVDNELGGTDVSVRPSWSKVWNKVKKGVFRPSEWLVTEQGILCTVRWSGAFLCEMGSDWNAGNGGKELLDLFFSRGFWKLTWALDQVMWNIGEENCVPELLTIHGLHRQLAEKGIGREMSTAYGTQIPRYRPRTTFNSYAFEFDSLASSYPSSNDEVVIGNREKVTVKIVNSLVVAKHLGVEKLRKIRRFYDRYRIPTIDLRLKSVKVLLEQLQSFIPDGSKILRMFLFDSSIPIFPMRMQMIALWDESTNWRILQASARQDIQNSLLVGRSTRNSLPVCQVEPRPENFFDYCAEIIRGNVRERENPPYFLGAVMETVRTFLAEWLASGEQEPDWEPAIPTDQFELLASRDLQENVYEFRNSLIWACQCALQKEVARTSSIEGNLPSNHALIMLFLLGFPGIYVENVDVAVFDAPKSQGATQEANASVTNMESSISVSVRVWRVSTTLAPQDVSVVIHYDTETCRISLQLKNDSDGAQFIWQDWVDAAMGYFRGFDEGISAEVKHNRTIVRADLRLRIVELCPLRANYEGPVEKTGIARIWMGWLPFNVRLCKFEMEQLLAARDINLSEHFDFYDENAADREVQLAEHLMKVILSLSATEK